MLLACRRLSRFVLRRVALPFAPLQRQRLRGEKVPRLRPLGCQQLVGVSPPPPPDPPPPDDPPPPPENDPPPPTRASAIPMNSVR